MSYPETTQAGSTIVEESTIKTPQGVDVINVAPPQAAKTIRAEANLLEEYVGVVGGYTPWLGASGFGGAYIRQLPNPVDDLMLSFGSRLYDDDMPRDAQVYSVLSALVMALLCQGVTLTNPIPDTDPMYEEGKKVLTFHQYNLANLRRPISAIMYELAEGMLKMGHKVGELIYDERDLGKGAGPQYIWCDVKTKAHNATAFVIDGFANTVGLLYIRPGQALPVLGSLLIENPNLQGQVPQMIPRSKFIIPTHKPQNGDPRGTSHLKAIYESWWKKKQLSPQHMAFVARFAQPSIVAELPADAKDVPVYDQPGGNIVKYKSIVQSTTDALAKIKGGAVATFVNTKVNMLQATGEGKVIFDSYDHEDRQIAKGILLQTLTTEESRHMARSASSIHEDVFGILVAFLRNGLEWVLRNEALKPLTLYNFGEDAANNLTPNVSLGTVQVQDIPKLMAAIAQLALAGGVHDSMWPAIRSMLSLPPADPIAEEQDQQAKEQQAAALADRQNQLRQSMNAPGFQPTTNPGAGDESTKWWQDAGSRGDVGGTL